MVVKKKKIVVEGQEIEVPVFDTKIIFGEGNDIDALDKLSKEEEIERTLQVAIKRIKIVKTKYKNIVRNIDYFYEVGKILQFVDKEDYFKKQRGQIWQRMANDISPDLFLFDERKEPSKSKRYPEFMYLLAKIPKELIKQASWYQWYEIVKFKNIYKKQKLLKDILEECKDNGAGPYLRNKIKILLEKINN
ncbi:MAG: hypothetical protein NTW06_00220 [Candidatus Falkowbacteria bacterium]|nr:hypothetical protein [Candidatus Falkowbacteria bacterium]